MNSVQQAKKANTVRPVSLANSAGFSCAVASDSKADIDEEDKAEEESRMLAQAAGIIESMSRRQTPAQQIR